MVGGFEKRREEALAEDDLAAPSLFTTRQRS
jgi:hypothetical protein